MKLIEIADKILDGITMYRLVVYALGVYLAAAIALSFMGKLFFSPTTLIVSLALIAVPGYIVDKAFGYFLKVPTNSESWLITSLILFFVLLPAQSTASGIALVIAGTAASASKFIINWKGKHAFNPAAFAAALVSVLSLQTSAWWIGGNHFWVLTLVLGVAVVRKIRRASLVATFVAVALALQLAQLIVHHQPIISGMQAALIASPLLFLSTIMLTEPATMPPRRRGQVIFAVLVAVLYVGAWKVGPLVIYPEVALLIGNLYAFLISPKFGIRLRLKEVQRISDRVYNYVFQPERRFSFLPGQYMEWTLAGVPFDSRGNRRTFTIASSPTEPTVQLGVKFYDRASAFKNALAGMQLGDSIYANQLAGNFTIKPKGKNKLAFVAGGIGITPFRSIIKYLSDTETRRDIVLLYVVTDPAELAYRQEFAQAARLGVRLVPVVTARGPQSDGFVRAELSAALLKQYVPDYDERTFYLSGPSGMVDAVKTYLQDMQVSPRRIKTDHFSGY